MEYQGLLQQPDGGGDELPSEGLLAQDARDAAGATMRRHVQPPEGRADFSPEHLAAIAQAAMLLGVTPEILMMKLAMHMPKVTAGVAGAMSMVSPSAMGAEDDFKWSDPNADRSKEMTDIQNRVNERAGKINTLATTKTNSPAGTQKLAIENLTALNHPEGADMRRLSELRDQQSTDRGEALKLWQAKTQSEKPFRQEWPDAYRGLPIAGWLLSALGGLAGAKGGAPIKAMLGGAAGGTLASAAAAVGPTAYDAATLPTGSKYQKQANDWLRDPEYYLGRVAPEVAVGMLLGALGGKWGATMKPSPKGTTAPMPRAEAPPPTTGLLSPEASVAKTIPSATSPIANNKTLKELMDLADMAPLPKKGRR